MDIFSSLNLTSCAKRDISSLCRGQYYAGKQRFENSASFLGFSPPSTLIRHENEAFRKRSSNWRNLKTLTFCLDGEFRKQSFFENDDNTMVIYISCDFSDRERQIENDRLLLRRFCRSAKNTYVELSLSPGFASARKRLLRQQTAKA